MASAKQLAIAAVATALVMFVWGGLAHMVLMRGVGFSRLPDEERTLDAIRSTVREDGLYFFPGIDFDDPSADEQAAWEARSRRGPTGFLVFHAAGSDPTSPAKLLVQLLSTLVAGVMAAFVASRARGAYVVRVLAVASIGAGGLATISTIYWNWYGYPDAFFVAQIVDQLVAWTLGGLIAVRILPEPA